MLLKMLMKILGYQTLEIDWFVIDLVKTLNVTQNAITEHSLNINLLIQSFFLKLEYKSKLVIFRINIDYVLFWS